MQKVLSFLCSLLLSAAVVQADDIVVYRGTARLSVDAQTAAGISPAVKAYYVLNFTDGTVSQILYFNKLGKKLVANTSQMRLARATLPNARNATLLATGSATNTAPDDFFFATFLARGVDSALLIETTPAKRTIERPRAFSGKSVFVNADAGDPAAFQDATLTLNIDAAKTIAANNEDRTVAQITDQIVAGLTSQGYQPQ